MALPTRLAPNGTSMTARWDPFREIEEAWSRMGSLLGDVASGADRPTGLLAGALPPVDIEETDDAFVVELELPGVRCDDVSIDLHDDELHVSGEIHERDRDGILRRQTRRTGRFEHRIVLPGEVDADSVTANLDAGVLTMTLGKARRSQPRHIEVTDRGAGAPSTTPGPAAMRTPGAPPPATAPAGTEPPPTGVSRTGVSHADAPRTDMSRTDVTSADVPRSDAKSSEAPSVDVASVDVASAEAGSVGAPGARPVNAASAGVASAGARSARAGSAGARSAGARSAGARSADVTWSRPGSGLGGSCERSGFAPDPIGPTDTTGLTTGRGHPAGGRVFRSELPERG